MIRNLTLQEVLDMPEERREFIDGELYMPPAPEPEHQSIIVKLVFKVQTHLENHPLGKILIAPVDVIIAEKLCQPDFAFINNERLGIIKQKNLEGAPDWLIEVVSPSTRKRDFETKKRLYLENGVREYWIVAQDGQVVWVFTPDSPEGNVYGKEDLEPSVLPGLKISVPSLFQA